MRSLNLLNTLLQNGQIASVTLQEAQILSDKEHVSLKRLQQQPASYLNHYDQLFRHVSLWLLQHGYNLTDYQPHQSLMLVTRQWACEQQLRLMIKRRHALKKRLHLQPPTLAEQNTLRALLTRFESNDTEPCQQTML